MLYTERSITYSMVTVPLFNLYFLHPESQAAKTLWIFQCPALPPSTFHLPDATFPEQYPWISAPPTPLQVLTALKHKTLYLHSERPLIPSLDTTLCLGPLLQLQLTFSFLSANHVLSRVL